MVGTAARCELGLSKVKRYWPGKAPDWGVGNAADEDDDFPMVGFSSEDEKHVAVKVQQCVPEAEPHTEEVRADSRRHVQQAEIVSTVVPEDEERKADDVEDDDDDDNDDDDDETAWEERRKRIRAKQLASMGQEDLLPLEDDAAMEEESEEETDSESEDEQTAVVPNKSAVFVPKSQRDTIVERQQQLMEEERLDELAKKRLDDRKAETKRIVVEVIRREELQADNATLNEPDCISTDDESNEAEEYESWKRRELARIKRGREEQETTAASNLIEEEHLANPNDPLAPRNKRRRFMQKYYHKGCFFLENPDDARQTTATSSTDIFSRDFSAPTGEDKMDKTVLPKVMQVRNFGRRGRTKWTHLLNEDTTYATNMPPVFSSFACQYSA